MQTLYLGLGSNLGDRKVLLQTAIERLCARPGVTGRVAGWYETEPVDYLDQPWFLNTVVELTLSEPVSPFIFLAECLALETEFGRVRTVPKGARTLDIDLLLCRKAQHYVTCDEYRDGVWLTLPHPRLHLRRFVLEPLCDLCPDAIHPGLGKSFRTLLSELEDESIVRRVTDDLFC